MKSPKPTTEKSFGIKYREQFPFQHQFPEQKNNV